MQVVMTGAAGGVGTMTREHLQGAFERFVVSDIREITDLRPGETYAKADLTDLAQMEALFEGADGVIHLGGQPVEADWDTIRDLNIDGLYNTFEAARRQRVKRMVFATTNHVVGFYRRSDTIDETVPPRPDSRYGASKAFGEALGRLYADKYGLRVFNIRIGNCDQKPLDIRRLSIWVSPRDLAQLFKIGLEHPDIHYEIVYGASRCARGWWDNTHAYVLGYEPKDNAEDHADEAHAKSPPEDPVGAQFHGGPFTSAEFAGDPKRID